MLQTHYVVRDLATGRLALVVPSRSVYRGGQVIVVEGEDIWGVRYPVNAATLVSVVAPTPAELAAARAAVDPRRRAGGEQ